MSLPCICQLGTVEELRSKTPDIIKEFEENDFSDIMYWSSRDQNCERGYEKTKFLMECAKEKKYDLCACCKGSMMGIIQSQNWKILNEIKPYIDINEFHDELDLRYDFDTFDKTKIFLPNV